MSKSKYEHWVQPNYNTKESLIMISCTVNMAVRLLAWCNNTPVVYEAETSAAGHAVLSVRLHTWLLLTPSVKHIHHTHTYASHQ